MLRPRRVSTSSGKKSVSQCQRAEHGALDPWWLNLRFWGAPIFSLETPKPLFWRVSESFGAPNATKKGQKSKQFLAKNRQRKKGRNYLLFARVGVFVLRQNAFYTTYKRKIAFLFLRSTTIASQKWPKIVSPKNYLIICFLGVSNADPTTTDPTPHSLMAVSALKST